MIGNPVRAMMALAGIIGGTVFEQARQVERLPAAIGLAPQESR